MFMCQFGIVGSSVLPISSSRSYISNSSFAISSTFRTFRISVLRRVRSSRSILIALRIDALRDNSKVSSNTSSSSDGRCSMSCCYVSLILIDTSFSGCSSYSRRSRVFRTPVCSTLLLPLSVRSALLREKSPLRSLDLKNAFAFIAGTCFVKVTSSPL